jgi:hypothetical protein
MEHDGKCELREMQAAYNRKGGDITDAEVFIVRQMTQQCCNCQGRRTQGWHETFVEDLTHARNLVDAVSQIRENGITVKTVTHVKVLDRKGNELEGGTVLQFPEPIRADQVF